MILPSAGGRIAWASELNKRARQGLSEALVTAMARQKCRRPLLSRCQQVPQLASEISQHLQGVAVLESLCRRAGGDGAVSGGVLPRSVHEPHRVQVDAVLQRRLAVCITARTDQRWYIIVGSSLAGRGMLEAAEGAMPLLAARIVLIHGLP